MEVYTLNPKGEKKIKRHCDRMQDTTTPCKINGRSLSN
jgi:hypothetical protein